MYYLLVDYCGWFPRGKAVCLDAMKLAYVCLKLERKFTRRQGNRLVTPLSKKNNIKQKRKMSPIQVVKTKHSVTEIFEFGKRNASN